MTKLITDKLPTGVELRKRKNGAFSLRIAFMYKGERCREPLKNLPPTKTNINYAKRLRDSILLEIGEGTFDYAKHFPNSKNARKFGHAIDHGSTLIKDLLEKYLSRLNARTESSTHRGYKFSIKNHLMPHLGHIPISDLNAMPIRDMIESMKKVDRKTGKIKPLKIKTIRNHLIPLRDIIKEALSNKMLKEDPMTHVIFEKFLPRECFKSDYIILPYSQEEIQTILNFLASQQRFAERNMVQFWFFAGPRPSEIRAVEWQDVDFDANIIRIERALVLKQLKGPKTEAGNRDIMMLPPVQEALMDQKKYTFGQQRRIFFNPSTKRPWDDDNQLWKWWTKVLKDAGVKYRNPYQCRHTYASNLLSHGENQLWLATQMGHVNTEVITKTYAKWIPDNKQRGGYKCKNDWGSFLKQKADKPNSTVVTWGSTTNTSNADKPTQTSCHWVMNNVNSNRYHITFAVSHS